MKVKELINELSKCDKNKEIIYSNDEELNHLFTNFTVTLLEDGRYCLYPYGKSNEELNQGED